MINFEEFYETFKECIECRKTLPESMRNNGFTFYASRFNDYKYMIILQNPLYNKERHKKEKTESTGKSIQDRAKIHQKYFLEWFLKGNREKRRGQNYRFIERFLDLLKSNGLISYDDTPGYLETGFFNDFYVTDIVKYWGATGDITDALLKHSVHHLIDEIINVRPELIFSFSTRVWDCLYPIGRDKFELSPIQGWGEIERHSDLERSVETLANVHGHLFRGKYADGIPFHLIPLIHLSKNARYNLIRDSYFNCLKEGLQNYPAIMQENQ